MLGKITAKTVATKLNLALLFSASVLPDLDFLFFRFIEHRGPLHSLLFCLLVSLPFLVFYKKKAVPYFVALLSHSLIGDIFYGGVQLFWPVSTEGIYILSPQILGDVNLVFELVLFVVCTVVMVISKDFQKLLQSKTSWVYWMIPFGAVLGPLLVTIVHPYYMPLLLVLLSLFYVALFSFLILKGLKLMATSGIGTIFVRG